MRPKILFIDRDGTLISETKNEQIDSFDKLSFLPGVFEYLGRIARELDFLLVLVTNQDGLGTEAFPEKDFWPVQDFIMRCLAQQSIYFKEVAIDRSYPQDNMPTRKPGTGLLTHYMNSEYDLKNSFVIGDRLTDMELAKNLGCLGIFIDHNNNLGQAEISVKEDELDEYIAKKVKSWIQIYEFLKLGERRVVHQRYTKETKIDLILNLDGEGIATITTGLHFFDHMLEQLVRHGRLDLELKVDGDLQIDEHHTIEDTAIALGEAFVKALGDKRGIERYGFTLPMDDCLAQVALDFGGRSWLEWQVEFKREKIGDMPTEMFFHFFRSFADAAKANINVKAEGDNEHHKIESIFKAWAKAIASAIRRDPERMIVPSTKGSI